eukprot:560467-Hanusia_phi.AAC.2
MLFTLGKAKFLHPQAGERIKLHHLDTKKFMSQSSSSHSFVRPSLSLLFFSPDPAEGRADIRLVRAERFQT